MTIIVNHPVVILTPMRMLAMADIIYKQECIYIEYQPAIQAIIMTTTIWSYHISTPWCI